MTDETIEPSVRELVAAAIRNALPFGDDVDPRYMDAANATLAIVQSAAPPSPRSDDGSGFVQVTNALTDICMEMDPVEFSDMLDADEANDEKLQKMLSTPHSTAVSAIAQERDVGEPVAYIVEGQKHRHLQWTPEVAKCDAPLVTIQPLYLHPTTSPSAISEAPTSAEDGGSK